MDPEPARDRPSRQSFSADEMGEIIETAARLDGLASDPNQVTLDEITQVAAELGISDEAVLAAVAERRKLAEAERARQAERAEERRKRAKAWRSWRAHLASYIGVNVGMFLLDWVTGGGLTFWFFPAIAWGIGLTIHTLLVVFNAADEDDD